MSDKVVDPYVLGLDVINVKGDECLVLCPYHNDRHPSASFNVRKGLFHCFTCGVNANVKEIAFTCQGVIRYIDDDQIRVVHKGKKEWTHLLYEPLAIDNAYLRSRKVSNDLVEKFEIRQHSTGVLFPLKDKMGKYIGMLERRYAGVPKYFFYGERPALWPFVNLYQDSEYLFVTEGVFGVLNAERCGANAVSVLSATGISLAIPYLNGRNCVAVFDDDFSGYVAASKMLIHGFKVANPPVEADEISCYQWRAFLRGENSTRWYGVIRSRLHYTDDKVKYYKIMNRYRKMFKKMR